MFPITNKPGIKVQCICCRQYFCHQHWNCRNQARNKVSDIQTHIFPGITPNSLNKNSFEQRVVKDYLGQKRWNMNQLRDDIFAKCEAAGDWEIDDDVGAKQPLKKDSPVCRN